LITGTSVSIGVIRDEQLAEFPLWSNTVTKTDVIPETGVPIAGF
jgi:hypothetical protein